MELSAVHFRLSKPSRGIQTVKVYDELLFFSAQVHKEVTDIVKKTIYKGAKVTSVI